MLITQGPTGMIIIFFYSIKFGRMRHEKYCNEIDKHTTSHPWYIQNSPDNKMLRRGKILAYLTFVMFLIECEWTQLFFACFIKLSRDCPIEYLQKKKLFYLQTIKIWYVTLL